MRYTIFIFLFISIATLGQDTLRYDQLISSEQGKNVRSKYRSKVTGAKQYIFLKNGRWLYYDTDGRLVKEQNFKAYKSKHKYLKHGYEVYINPNIGDTVLIREYSKGQLVNQLAFCPMVIVEKNKIINVYKDFNSFAIQEYKTYGNDLKYTDFVSSWKSTLDDPRLDMGMDEYLLFEDSLGDPSMLEPASHPTLSQYNYVANPEFENHKAPFSIMSFTDQIQAWKQASESPDLYLSPEEAHSGASFVGFRVFSMTKHIEYIQNELRRPLQKDSIYCFSAYLKLSPSSMYASNAFGISFSSSEREINTDELLSVTADVSLNDQVLNYKTRWMKVQCTYKAKGGERWMTIGSFKDHKSLELVEVPGFSRESYYYLDDVSLVPIAQADDCPCNFSDQRQPNDASAQQSDDELDQLNALRVGESFVLKDIHFENDKSELLPASFKSLNNVLSILLANPTMAIEISGHTSSQGGYNHNMRLSEKRAKAVQRFLVLNGVLEDRIQIVGHGPDQPIASNDTAEGQQLNRRVEFKVLSL